MFTLIRTLGLEAALARELPPLVVAFTLAEIFYKFGSFALECVAFLATWFVLSALWSKIAIKRD